MSRVPDFVVSPATVLFSSNFHALYYAQMFPAVMYLLLCELLFWVGAPLCLRVVGMCLVEVVSQKTDMTKSHEIHQ